MPDMLVPLYKLPSLSTLESLPYQQKGIQIVRAMAPNMNKITSWVKEYFTQSWASECAITFTRTPITCFLALKENQIIGFGCYEATYPTFFGPTGVLEEYRNLGIGKGLLLNCLHGLHQLGYPYGIIGWAGPVDFYKKTVNAIEIEDSFPDLPGSFEHILR